MTLWLAIVFCSEPLHHDLKSLMWLLFFLIFSRYTVTLALPCIEIVYQTQRSTAEAIMQEVSSSARVTNTRAVAVQVACGSDLPFAFTGRILRDVMWSTQQQKRPKGAAPSIVFTPWKSEGWGFVDAKRVFGLLGSKRSRCPVVFQERVVLDPCNSSKDHIGRTNVKLATSHCAKHCLV